MYFSAAVADKESNVSLSADDLQWKSGKQRWQQLINTFTGKVQVWLQEGQGVSADEAYVELKTEDSPTVARMAVYIVANHLESKIQTSFCVGQH